MAHNLISKTQTNRRAVAPVIATLLMVAIAVVGGTLIFVFSQGFFSQSQISGSPTIESIKILGYDARDQDDLQAHDDGTLVDAAASDEAASNNVKAVGERFAAYMKNDSVQQVTFAELRIGGEVYGYIDGTGGGLPALAGANFTIYEDSAVTIDNASPVVLPGQAATVYVNLNKDFPVGRDTQFKLTTTNGQVFVGTIVMGQQSG